MTIDIEHLKRHVLAGGGQFVALQECVPPEPPQVLFNSPISGTTLSLPADKCYSAEVHEHITKSDKNWRKSPIKVPRYKLVHILDNLHKLAEEIEELLEEKR